MPHGHHQESSSWLEYPGDFVGDPVTSRIAESTEDRSDTWPRPPGHSEVLHVPDLECIPRVLLPSSAYHSWRQVEAKVMAGVQPHDLDQFAGSTSQVQNRAPPHSLQQPSQHVVLGNGLPLEVRLIVFCGNSVVCTPDG